MVVGLLPRVNKKDLEMRNEYRIVQDAYFGFEVQTKKWWFPFFWWQCHSKRSFTNTHGSAEEAAAFANEHAKNRGFVEYLGKLP